MPTQSINDSVPIDAFSRITRNADWTPVEREINGTSFVLVPAGCFEMGSTQTQVDAVVAAGLSRDWANRELPQHEQCFDEPFWISKTEVTNAEYAEFITAGGYDNPDYWTAAGWQQRQSRNWTQPSRWEDSNFNDPDQPVVGVSWYEAMAYATWREMTLPTERQWEYAARGPDGLIYPWGNESVTANLVNSRNSGGRPAVVGSRPAGVSWVGALDIAGNVMNWTVSEMRVYPYHTDDGRENISAHALRVLRGSSWGGDHHFARAASRYYADPVRRDDFVGFRLLRLPHSS